MDISIAILCGGMSRRFGKDKTLFKYMGRPLYLQIYEKLSPLTDDIFLQCGKKDKKIYSVRSFNDDYLDLGPLGGIYSALKNSKYPRTFIVGCDMPNISTQLVKQLARYKGDIVVPVWDSGHCEPLSAIYSKKLVPILEYNILTDKLKMSKLFEENDTKKVKIESLIKQGLIDKDQFKNVNRIVDI
ncbi:MAG TPA: molybdenum cofactor guanylyltransferase [Candidatus Methanofastidiosa archaeon]|nr:molybdenum cofactor guanylyltransferase [Candidatus Methanofastidiosa archaeon]HPR42249.1 molybdenum cofactor guanylyltransferase [Candidatus Methanofastidiosa archaeon]